MPRFTQGISPFNKYNDFGIKGTIEVVWERNSFYDLSIVLRNPLNQHRINRSVPVVIPENELVNVSL